MRGAHWNLFFAIKELVFTYDFFLQFCLIADVSIVCAKRNVLRNDSCIVRYIWGYEICANTLFMRV